MALVLDVRLCEPCSNGQNLAVGVGGDFVGCDSCRHNLASMAAARASIHKLTAALDAWSAVTVNLWSLVRLGLPE